MSSFLKRAASVTPSSPSKKVKVEEIIDLTGDDEEEVNLTGEVGDVEEGWERVDALCFFEIDDMVNVMDTVQVVRIGATRLNLLFDAETGPFGQLMGLSGSVTLALEDENLTDRLEDLDARLDASLAKAFRAQDDRVKMAEALDIHSHKDFKLPVALRLFTRYNSEIASMILSLQTLCAEQEDLDDFEEQFGVMHNTFIELDGDACHKLLEGKKVDFLELGNDGLYIDVSEIECT